METIITLLAIGYSIGFIIIAYFGIVGTNEVINYHNNRKGNNESKKLQINHRNIREKI